MIVVLQPCIQIRAALSGAVLVQAKEPRQLSNHGRIDSYLLEAGRFLEPTLATIIGGF